MPDHLHNVRTYTYACDATITEDGITALKALDSFQLFFDCLANARESRSSFNRLKLYLQPGDTLTVWSLDCLGTDLEERYITLRWLSRQNITLKALTQTGEVEDFLKAAKAELEHEVADDSEGHSTLCHLSELEMQATNLFAPYPESDAPNQARLEGFKAMVSDLRKHLKFVAQQIRIGEPHQALKRIDQLSSDF